MDRKREARRPSTNGISRRRHQEDEPGRLRKLNRDRINRTKKRRNDVSDSSEGSVDDDVDGGDDDTGTARMLTPNQAHSHSHVQQHSSKNKGFKPVQGWKPADELIGFSVPRKARSMLKRSSTGAAPEQNQRQASPPSTATAPPSPSTSNVSARKKMKPNVSEQKPTKSNPGELEIEIAEVLYGLMTQLQDKKVDKLGKIDPNGLKNESIPRVSSPISNSASTALLFGVAEKRKKPRQVSENSGISSTMGKKPDINADKKSTTESKNGNFHENSPHIANLETTAKELPPPAGSPVRFPPDDSHDDMAGTKVNSISSVKDIHREEKYEIDLMAPPPQPRASPERESDIDFVSVSADAEMRKMMVIQDKDKKSSKNCKDDMVVQEPVQKKAKFVPESAEPVSTTMNIDLQLNLEKSDRDFNSLSLSGNSKTYPHVEKQQQPQLKIAKDDQPHTEKSAQAGSLQLPMSLPNWPGGLPPMGYIAPLQGVGIQVPPTPMPLFSQPRPKRCGTHCYIARNIHCLQQLMKMNRFWPSAVGPTMREKAVSQPANLADAQRMQQQMFLQQGLPPGAPPTNMMHGPAFMFPFNYHQAAAAATSVRPGPTNASPNSATSASGNGSAAAAPTPTPVSFNYPNNIPSKETQYLAFLQNNNNPYPFPIPSGTHPHPIPFFYPPQMIMPGQQNQNLQTQKQIINPQQKSGNTIAFASPKNKPALSHHQVRGIENDVGNDNNKGENKKQQQSQNQNLNPGVAMSFPGGIMDLSSVPQNQAFFQNFSEANKRNFQLMQAAAAAQMAQQKKKLKVSEEGKKGLIYEGKKGLATKASVTNARSVSFSRPDSTDPLVSSTVRKTDANNKSVSTSSHLEQQHIQQQIVLMQKQQQQLQQQYHVARNIKSPPTNNNNNNNLSQSPQPKNLQISFGSGQKSQTVQKLQPLPNSPTNSLSKSGNKTSSLLSQNSKTSSILGNFHNISSSNSLAKSVVQQQSKQMGNSQAQLFLSPAYMPAQLPNSALNPNNSNTKGLSQSNPNVQLSGSLSYVHKVPAVAQGKSTEQKKPFGNCESLAKK